MYVRMVLLNEVLLLGRLFGSPRRDVAWKASVTCRQRRRCANDTRTRTTRTRVEQHGHRLVIVIWRWHFYCQRNTARNERIHVRFLRCQKLRHQTRWVQIGTKGHIKTKNTSRTSKSCTDHHQNNVAAIRQEHGVSSVDARSARGSNEPIELLRREAGRVHVESQRGPLPERLSLRPSAHQAPLVLQRRPAPLRRVPLQRPQRQRQQLRDLPRLLQPMLQSRKALTTNNNNNNKIRLISESKSIELQRNAQRLRHQESAQRRRSHFLRPLAGQRSPRPANYRRSHPGSRPRSATAAAAAAIRSEQLS